MFSLAASPFDIPPAITAAADAVWRGLAAPGASFTGGERLGIARRARAERLNEPDGDPPEAAAEAVHMLAATPARTSRRWVDEMVATLGSQGYVEVAGIVARVVAVDTFARLVGVQPVPFPPAVGGDPVPAAIPEGARKGKAWIPIAGFPVPPFALSIVPDEMAATNRLHDSFYMTGGQMEDPAIVIDGLHRTQIETVATTVSHRNDCFY